MVEVNLSPTVVAVFTSRIRSIRLSNSSFSDLGISDSVIQSLAKQKIESALPIQSAVIPDALAGNDILAKSPTGSGKTLAFGLPLLERIDAKDRCPAALVLVPTRELAKQVVDGLFPHARARSLRLAAVYGGVNIGKQIKTLRGSHLLVATPGRLIDLLQRRALKLDSVRMLVLDEADRMLDMGFRPDVDRIVEALPAQRQTLFFSATLDKRTQAVADVYTTNPCEHEYVPPVEQRGKVQHHFIPVIHDGKVDTLIEHLHDEKRKLTIVFVRTKRGADRVVQRLVRKGFLVDAIHGDKSQSQRQRTLKKFSQGHIDTLVATDVAARGIDIDDVTHVINFDPPEDREGYVHRIGRTGRVGRIGTGITYVMRDQAHEVRQIARSLKLHQEFEQTGYEDRRPAKKAGGHKKNNYRGGGRRFSSAKKPARSR